MKYQVINRMSKVVVGTYSTKARARRARDKRDAEHGSYAFAVIEIDENGKITRTNVV